MTFPEVHLAGEAVVAFVDGELASVAHARALAHLDVCAECRCAVRVQREASRLLSAAPDPVVPAGLLARLREIPMTTELSAPEVVLAVEGGDLVWASTADARARPARSHEAGRSRPDPRPGRGDGRPPSYPPGRESGRTRRARRALAGAVAGLAFGVCVATASTSVYAHTDTPDRNLIRDVNGGVVRPPVTGAVIGVRNLRAPDQGRGGADPSGVRRDDPDASGGTVGTESGQPTGAQAGDPRQAPTVSGPDSGGGVESVGSTTWNGGGSGRTESVSGTGMR